MRGVIQKKITVHKEEKPGSVKSDKAGYNKRRPKLERCTDPFDTKSHPT